jgi:YD repeat-containing protein
MSAEEESLRRKALEKKLGAALKRPAETSETLSVLGVDAASEDVALVDEDVQSADPLLRKILSVDEEFDDGDKLPESLLESLNEALLDVDSRKSFLADPAFRHPVLGAPDEKVAGLVEKLVSHATDDDIVGKIGAELGNEAIGRLAKAFVLSNLPDGEDAVEDEREVVPNWSKALSTREKRELLALVNDASHDGTIRKMLGDSADELLNGRPIPDPASLDKFLPGDETAFTFIGHLLEKISPPTIEEHPTRLTTIVNGLNTIGIEALFQLIRPHRSIDHAEIVSTRKELRGGQLSSVEDDLIELVEIPDRLREIKERLLGEIRDPGCRIRIDGPSRIDIRDNPLFHGVLEAGDPGGEWSWEVIPTGAAATFAGAGGRGLPILRYRPEQLGFALLILRYVSPHGQSCMAVRELEHTMPECLIYFVRARSRLGWGQKASYFVKTLPESTVSFKVTDPDGVVQQWQKMSDTQIDVTTKADTGRFTIIATHDDGRCNVEHTVLVKDMTESVNTPSPGSCSVSIVGPAASSVGKTETYTATGDPPGGRYTWSVMPPGTADIVQNSSETAQITPRVVGALVIFVVYEVGGCVAESTGWGVDFNDPEGDDPRDTPPPTLYGEELNGEDVMLVRQRDPDQEKPTVPLVQHVPNCYVKAPADGGHPLSPGADFEIRAIRVFDEWEEAGGQVAVGLQAIDLSKLDPSIRVDLRMEGKLWDTLILIQGMRVEVEEGETFVFAPGEFWDNGFKKWTPGSTTPGKNVQVEGLRIHHLRVFPTNALVHDGLYHLDVVCELSEAGARAVAEAQRLLDQLLKEPYETSDSNAVAAREARIIARVRNLASAWRDALWNAQVRSRHNDHLPHTTNISNTCRFRVRGFPDSPAGGSNTGQVESVPSAPEDLQMGRDATNRMLSLGPHPDFFVTLDVYPKAAPKTFVKDGLLHGRADQPTRGYYPHGGDTDEEITYGVAGAGPPCLKINPGDLIRLHATGTPAVWEQWIGQFSWSMVSYPEGANSVFTPTGPTPQPFTDVQVDRPGHYVARVDSVIDHPGNQCNQTYAIIDFHVIMDSNAALMLLRVGDYRGEVSDHATRPFYRRRTLEEQEGTDLLVYPKDSGHLGHHQHIFMTVDKVLILNPGLTVRVYTKTDRSEWRDYQGAPTVRVCIAGPNTAEIQVESLEPIYALHIMNIRYTGLLKLPGHAVEVTLTVLPQKGCPEEIQTGDTVGLDPEIPLVPEEVTAPEDDVAILTRVNLLLYGHDLGIADAGNAVQEVLPANDLLRVNVANGNLHYQLPMFAWRCRGMSLACALHYNSFHAAQMEAVERMARINGISIEEREKEYARTGVGYGWSYTFGVHLIDYVLSEGGGNMRKRLELIDGTGNHIQFEAHPPLGGTFRPIGRGTMFEGDHVRGSSLSIKETKDGDTLTGYEMTDLYRNRYRFDEIGRLTEITTIQARASNGALAPVKIEHTSARTTVTDTVGRTLTAWVDSTPRINRIENSAHQVWTLTHHLMERSRLWLIGDPDANTLEYNYRDYNLLNVFKNGRNFETSFEFVKEGDGWGRNDKVTRTDLVWKIGYDPVTPDATSKAEATNARGTKLAFVWDRDSLALKTISALRLRQENSFGVADQRWILVDEYAYYDEPSGSGKFVSQHTDLYGFVRSWEYLAVVQGHGFLQESLKLDGTLIGKFEYDTATNRVFKKTDENGAVTEYAYDRYGNLEKIINPRLTDAADSLFIEWKFRSDGKQSYMKDLGGQTVTFEYGGDGDPHNVGLATGRSRGGDPWHYGYEHSGLPSFHEEPLYGGRTNFDYDNLDRLEKMTLPKGQAVTGSDPQSATEARAFTEFKYDGTGNQSSTTGSLGASSSAIYDEHDRMTSDTNVDGTAHFEYDGLGSTTMEKDRRGNSITITRDYVGRKFRIEHPRRTGGRLIEDFKFPDDRNGNIVHYVRASARGAVSIGYPRRYNEQHYDAFAEATLSRQWTKAGLSISSPVSEWIYGRDDLGNATSLEFKFGGTSRYKESYALDEWYRVKGVTVGSNVTTDYELGPYDEILAVTLPEHGAGSRATWRFGYDAHQRDTTVHDPNGRLVREVVYTSASENAPARSEVKGIPRDRRMPDPHQHHSGDATLTVLQSSTYDGRGLVIRENNLDLPEAESHYDQNGLLRIRKQGHSTVIFELDGMGREISAAMTDRVKTQTVSRRFDANGNLTFLSGTDFNTTYEYDNGDRLTREIRKKGRVTVTARAISYDILDRPKRLTAEDLRVFRFRYDERNSKVTYDVQELSAKLATVHTTYHWNGEVAEYRRIEDGSTKVQVTTQPPDELGRMTSTETIAENIVGEMKIAYWPAGTRKSVSISIPGRTLKHGDYIYYPDGQVKSIASANGGQHTFAYHPSGHLAAWVNPRGDRFALRRNKYSRMSHLEAIRSDGTTPIESSVTVFPASSPHRTQDRTSMIRHKHASGESPEQGTTTYGSTATYNAKGLLETLEHDRSGLGERIERGITNTYGPDGALTDSVEEHRFPGDTDKNYTVRKAFRDQQGNSLVQSRVDETEAELVSRYYADQRSLKDDFGRTNRIINVILVDPDIFTFWGDPRSWFRARWTFRRDEYGRQLEAYLRMETAKHEHRNFARFRPVPNSTNIRFLRDHMGQMISRAVTVKTKRESDNKDIRLEDQRLFLNDGGRVIAEIGRGNELLRYYEYGPGDNFRLNVLHQREGAAETVEHYLYTAGMASAALIANDGKIKTRFSALDLAGPGDNRLERVESDDDEDKLITPTASPLYIDSAEPSMGGMPPYVSSDLTVGVGSVFGRTPGPDEIGLLKPHPALVEFPFDRSVQMTPSGEFPRPDPLEPTAWDTFANIFDALISLNPVLGPQYRMAKFAYQIGKSGDEVEIRLFLSRMIWDALASYYGIPLNPVEPLVMAVSAEDYTWADYSLAAFDLRDPLVVLNGYDPVTGATYTWSERLDMAVALTGTDVEFTPLVELGDGCFPSDTVVWTPEGSRPISELWPGETVLSMNDGEIAHGSVVDLHTMFKPIWLVATEQGKFRVSGSQPLLVEGRGFVRVEEIRPGDELVAVNGARSCVVEVAQTGSYARVYNLSVGDNPHYAVTDQQWLAHNKPARGGRRRRSKRKKSKVEIEGGKVNFVRLARVGFSKKLKKAIDDVKPGQHRRHIVPQGTMRRMIMSALHGNTLEEAKQILREVGHDYKKYSVNRRTRKKRSPEDTIRAAAEGWLRELNDNPKNLWVGDGKMNSRYGSYYKMFRDDVTQWHPFHIDAEPGSKLYRQITGDQD